MQLMVWFFIGVGILMVFGVSVPIFGTGIGGLWLVLIGWFLSLFAGRAYRK